MSDDRPRPEPHKGYAVFQQDGPEFGGLMKTLDAPAGCEQCAENVTRGHRDCSVPPNDLMEDIAEGKLTRVYAEGRWHLALPDAPSIHLLVVDVPRGEARIVEVDLDHEGAYPIDPNESVASEHNTRREADDAWEAFHAA